MNNVFFKTPFVNIFRLQLVIFNDEKFYSILKAIKYITQNNDSFFPRKDVLK